MNDIVKTDNTLAYKLMVLATVLSFIPFVGLIFPIFPFIYSLVIQNKRLAIFTVIGTIFNILACFILVYLSFMPSDSFTAELYIPDDIEISRPLTLDVPDDMNAINWGLINKQAPGVTKFELVSPPGNPGIYELALWSEGFENGYFYLKAFEITKGTQLSSDRLKGSSSLRVTKGSPMSFQHQRFTIYEGDWGYPYAARFELWFDSDSTDRDIKVMNRNYIIEGWMR